MMAVEAGVLGHGAVWMLGYSGLVHFLCGPNIGLAHMGVGFNGELACRLGIVLYQGRGLRPRRGRSSLRGLCPLQGLRPGGGVAPGRIFNNSMDFDGFDAIST